MKEFMERRQFHCMALGRCCSLSMVPESMEALSLCYMLYEQIPGEKLRKESEEKLVPFF